MAPTRLGGILLVAVLLAVTVGAVGVAGLDGGETSLHATVDTEASATEAIDAALQSATGEIEAVLVLDPPSADTVANHDDPEAYLKDHAATVAAPIEDLAAQHDSLTITDTSWLTPSVTVTVNTDALPLTTLAALHRVVAIEAANHTVEVSHAETTNASPQGSHYTYGLEQINAPDAWDTFDTTGAGVSIAVLDTGADPDHPDIDVEKWRDFSDDPATDPLDYGNHGTHVAGTATGGDASGDHIGVAPDADLYVGAVLTDCDASGCQGDRSQVVDGMEWAIEEGADIISLSLGGDGYSTSYLQATQNAHAAGTTVVAATGNDGEGTASTPGNIYSLISVGATDSDEDVWSGSSGREIDTQAAWGDDAPDNWPDSYIVPDVTAPGRSVYSALPDDEYGYKTGTSMATPHVAGTIALMQAATDRHLSPETINAVLIDTAWQPGVGSDAEQDIRYGYGIIDAHAALDAVLATGTLTGTVTDSVTGDPLPDAIVTAVAEDGTTHETTTSTDGEYTFATLEPGTYTVSANRSGYEVASDGPAEIETDTTTTVDLTITGDALLAVTVTDATFNVSVDNASLDVSGPFGTYPVTSTDAGTYVIEDVPSVGSYEVAVDASGYEATTDTVEVTASAERTNVTVRIAGNAQLELTVNDTVSDMALNETTLEVARADGAGSTTTVTTADDGHASLTVAGRDIQYTVTATRTGYETASMTSSSLTDGETTQVDLELTGDAVFEVTVADEVFETPVDNGEVVATGPFGIYPTTEREDGTYRIESVPSIGVYDVDIAAPGYAAGTASANISGEPGRHALATTLTGDAELTISVSDAVTTTSLADVAVTLERVATTDTVTITTDTDGEAVVAVPGTEESYRVIAAIDGYEETADTIMLDSGDSGAVSLEVVGDATIHLAVEGERFGETVNNATVEAEGRHGTYQGKLTANGSYVIENVPSIGAYTITTNAPGYRDHETTIEVQRSGDTPPEPIPLEGDATLNITVIDPDEAGIEAATVTLEFDDTHTVVLDTVTPPSGTIEVSVPGRSRAYTVRAEADGFESTSVETTPVGPGENVSVTLQLETPSLLPGFGIPVAIAGILGALGYLLRRQRHQTKSQPELSQR